MAAVMATADDVTRAVRFLKIISAVLL